MIRCVGREVKIESVPPRVARAALQLDETGVNGSSFHAQTGRIRHTSVGWAWFKSPLAHNSANLKVLVSDLALIRHRLRRLCAPAPSLGVHAL
jgi:hypothetical protein